MRVENTGDIVISKVGAEQNLREEGPLLELIAK